MNLDERVTVNETVRTGELAPGLPFPQTSFLIYDSYQTQTQFHGGDIGVAARLIQGRFSLSAIVKLAIGANARDVTVAGSTGIAASGLPTVNFNGGLLTAGHLGQFSDTAFALVPECV